MPSRKRGEEGRASVVVTGRKSNRKSTRAVATRSTTCTPSRDMIWHKKGERAHGPPTKTDEKMRI